MKSVVDAVHITAVFVGVQMDAQFAVTEISVRVVGVKRRAHIIMEFLWKFLDSNFFSSVVSGLAIFAAYVIGKKQNQINELMRTYQDSVELFCTAEQKKITNTQDQTEVIVPIMVIRNIGDRIIYIDNYIFNDVVFDAHKNVLPPTRAVSDAIYWVDLPTDGTTEVNIKVNFHDSEVRSWCSEVRCLIEDGIWKIRTQQRMRIDSRF